MRCEMMQMDRMAAYDRLLEQEADAMYRQRDIARRIRREEYKREEQENEALGDLLADCGA